MYERILVSTDGSPLSQKAVRSAVELARATGAELVALTVVPPYPLSYFEGANLSLSAAQVAQTETQWIAQGQALVDAAAEVAREAGVPVRAITVRSDGVAEAILAAAKKNRCDLLVMASHGRKGLERLLLGSETQHVLTHGNIPVLVVR